MFSIIMGTVFYASGTVKVLIWKLNGCPNVIIDFVRNYPEAESFAANYKKYAKRNDPIDVSGEVGDGKIPLWIQWEPRWGYRPYGSSVLGVTGCGPTCMAMVYCGLTGDSEMYPSRMAAWAEDQGYYVYGVGTSWDLMTIGAQNLGLNAAVLNISETDLLSSLENGCLLIASVKPGNFTKAGHFIVLVGLDSSGRVVVHDPNSWANSSRTWPPAVLLEQIKGLWSYSYTEHLETAEETEYL